MNKTVVITGASGGIGREIALEVARRGGVPILLARSTNKLQMVCEEIRQAYGVEAAYFACDVSDVDAIKSVFDAILTKYKVDVLVNNAGYGKFDYAWDANLDDVRGMFDLNVVGLIAATQSVLPQMKANGGGQIVNVASIAGKLATPKSSVYAATKHAVLGFTNALRLEVEDLNIKVTAINPGPIKTNFFEIADKEGTYVKNVGKFMLESAYVAKRVVDVIEKPKREVNLPGWMGLGSKFYQAFPGVVETLAGSQFKKK